MYGRQYWYDNYQVHQSICKKYFRLPKIYQTVNVSCWSIAVITVLFLVLTINAKLSTTTNDSLIPFSCAFSVPSFNRSNWLSDSSIFLSFNRFKACFENIISSDLFFCCSNISWKDKFDFKESIVIFLGWLRVLFPVLLGYRYLKIHNRFKNAFLLSSIIC